MLHDLWAVFVELIVTPFRHIDLIWGIVPLYFGWLVNELMSGKASFSTAAQTGFGFLWSGAHWAHQFFASRPAKALVWDSTTLLAVNVLVTVSVLVIGLIAMLSGLRQQYPRYCSFLGHTRFSNYFMITMFSLQSNYLPWSWERAAAILIFAVPIWLAFHLGFRTWRK